MLPEDQIRLITCLVLSFFISYALGMVKCPKKFILGSFLATLLFQSYVFRWEVIILWMQQQIVYLICRYANREKIGKIILFETFGYLLIVQLRRMWIAYARNDVDITAVLMMQAFLYISFAYNYQDGL
jgi:lysophospholipid acyltransferase